MTSEEAISVLQNEKECVRRQGGQGCDHNCGTCDLVLSDEVIMVAYDMAFAALRAQAEANEPLTPAQLRELDGEPVWVDGPDGYKHYSGWALVDVSWKANSVIYLVRTHGPTMLCEALLRSGGKVYRRPPKEVSDHA